jgi:Flp pilus assembly protein TadG
MKNFWSKLFRIGRDARGATAVEFSILIIPFMLMIMGGLGTGTLYWANVAFDANVESVAKKVYEEAALCADGTPAFPYTTACLSQRICDESGLLLISRQQCRSRIKVDIRTVKADGSDPTIPAMVSASGIEDTAFGQQFGVKANVIVLIRAAVPVPNWSLWSPQNVAAGGERILTASAMFRVREQVNYSAVP